MGTMTAIDEPSWPTELRLHKDRKSLTIAFESGESHTLPAEYLRVKSPSAEVQGHAPEERKTVPGKRDVAIILAGLSRRAGRQGPDARSARAKDVGPQELAQRVGRVRVRRTRNPPAESDR
jgi:hypothetical protein